MRRPTAFLCGVYIFGMATELFLKLNNIIILIAIACMIIVIVFCIIFYKNNRLSWNKKRLCIFFVALILGIIGVIQYNYQVNKVGILEKNQGEYLQIQGMVISVVEKNERQHKIIVKVNNLEGVGELPTNEKILINIYGGFSDYYKLQGKCIQTKGFIEIPTARRNPKTFDYKIYLKTKKISTIMSVSPENLLINEKKCNLYLKNLSEIKYSFKSNVYGLFDNKIAGLLMGIIFGDNSGLSEEFYESFQKNGICHILAVSGVHIGALYMCINAVLGRKRKIKFYIIIVIILFFYASLANFSPSVIRAVLMIILHMISKYMHCRYDMFTAGMITMSVMVFFNPMSLLNLGFQLSFIAIFTLSVILPTAVRICNKFFIKVIVIQVGVVPISAFAYNYFSLSAFIVNIPVIFIAGMLIPLGMLLLLFSSFSMIIPSCEIIINIFSYGFQITGIIVEFFSKLLIFINDLAYIDKISYKYVTSPSLWSLLIYYSVLFFISSEIFRIMWQRKNYKMIFKFVIIIICISIIFGNSLKDGFEQVQFTFVDVGQGDCLLIKTSDGKNVLIDSGGSSQYDVGRKILLPYLLKNGVKEIDMAIITHLHTDHVGGLSSLSKEIPIKKVGIYEGNKLIADKVSKRIGVSTEKLMFLTSGQKLKLGKELEIEVLYPDKKSNEEYLEILEKAKDENAACLVMKVKLKNVSIMMNGDIGVEAEKNMLEFSEEESLDVDILKVAHHGSKYGSSQEFLEIATPQIAIIQVGKNTYGHPNNDTLKRLENIGAYIYRNDFQGAVGVEIKQKGEVRIYTMK